MTNDILTRPQLRWDPRGIDTFIRNKSIRSSPFSTRILPTLVDLEPHSAISWVPFGDIRGRASHIGNDGSSMAIRPLGPVELDGCTGSDSRDERSGSATDDATCGPSVALDTLSLVSSGLRIGH